MAIVTIVTDGGTAPLVRAGRLTPYDLELVAADVRRRGDARIEVVVHGTERDRDAVAAALAPLGARGVALSIERAGAPRPAHAAVATAPDVGWPRPSRPSVPVPPPANRAVAEPHHGAPAPA